MTTKLYFAYGSNLDAEQMRARCPSSEPLFRARLEHFRLDFTYYSSRWRGGAADVIRDSDREVWGVVYRLADADLNQLDSFESGYERLHIDVHDDRGERLSVTSYSVLTKRNFAPSDVYLEKMLRWGEHWKLPADYLAALRRVR